MSFLQDCLNQVRPRTENYIPPIDKIQRFLREDAGAISNTDDLFKRDNQELFLKKAVEGSLVDTAGNSLPKLSDSNELIKLVKSFSEPPESGSEEHNKLKALLKSELGVTQSKFAKAGNGFSPPSSGEPSGEEWEALISVAVHKYNDKKDWMSGDEWSRVGERFWSDYEKPAMKLGEAFSKLFKVSSIEQWGGGGIAGVTTSKQWQPAKNKTPKTDLYAGNGKYKISLKKHGGSQLMSAGKDEAISTFDAAISTYSMSSHGKKKVYSMITDLETKMGTMTEKGTIGSLEKKIASNKPLSTKDAKSAVELSIANLNADDLTKGMAELFKDIGFKSHFCWEAATGNIKFQPVPDAAANWIVTFRDSGSIANYMQLDSPEKAGKTLASGNDFYVSFKTGGGSSRPYLALRSKKLTSRDVVKEDVTFRDIILEEFAKDDFGMKLLNEDVGQLDEFALWNKIKKGVKSVSAVVVKSATRIVKAVMQRVKQAFNMIKKLGAKMLKGLLGFFGLNVSDVRVSGGGRYPLR